MSCHPIFAIDSILLFESMLYDMLVNYDAVFKQMGPVVYFRLGKHHMLLVKYKIGSYLPITLSSYRDKP